ncbi:hypothetical protein PHYBLDRAFT_125601 [Phycomyces blakesleeanus NRRL 1555(-)]|uniref:FAD/NAD(P)-binding domain-containing protein n=1 Tax=Phycomyces blakesleeanus (strain ATCC 8743b / DSM 1359 / FGSC 10004 / NBRC 33097 / NRRL 1555) TaxID=763407 RepID=A0A162PQ60_PHYB8|nr:hypothetical protein PHYBLDRAFT_125601 [Phycomyces blakesleeanus NRRL 1555(-)]OAD71886.1 hypothetical protein PHYBLDRAFT_125601 [Phycomyces blakesleeanus NRRL 1555(-)]|eukprot:XP_018289926.1 hypothetical protein PHYBLDRAFT_125601 [Phycomyces blakesleeanus NRRL 1555(-)]
MSNASKKTAAVLGAGFSGMCAAIQLKKRFGIVADLFDRNDDIGGTWLTNKYPGCACDIPSHLYSLSFEPNPLWSKQYSGQEEILQYMQNVAQKYDLYAQTKFQTEVICTTWLEDIQKWKVDWRKTTDHSQLFTGLYDFLFIGIGPLNIPFTPEELKGFEGTVVHTAVWDNSVDFTGKRVAVVGSGSRQEFILYIFVQLKSKDDLYLFLLLFYQRTPAWIMQRSQFDTPDFIKSLFVYLPFVLYIYRCYVFFKFLYLFLALHSTIIGKLARSYLEGSMKKELERAGKPELAPLLIPPFAPGCKRIGVSSTYLSSLARDNVTLIPCAVKSVHGRTIVDVNGDENEVDILVLATGYNVKGFTGNLKVYGRNGIGLLDEWSKEFPKTYKTVNVHGFPNMFFMIGPSSGIGHSTVVSVMECQVDLAMQCIKRIIDKNLSAVEPSAAAQDAFVAKLIKDLKPTVWNTDCVSWYKNDGGQVTGVWSGSIISFWWELRKSEPYNYIEYALNNHKVQ